MTEIFIVTQEALDAGSVWRNAVKALPPTNMLARVSKKCLKDLIRSIAETRYESGD
jgi:hypothetical protein